MAFSYEQLRDDYARRWDAMELRPDWTARARKKAQKVIDARRHYEPVSAATGVPWYVIGIIHVMECDGSFGGHLHNGDPLSARTVQVPKGLPLTGSPPFKWDESAIDALRYDGLDKVTDWGPERLAWCLEKFNGMGSRKRGVPSAYLWSGTDQYSKGKFIADHVWDGNHVSQQVGGMAIMKMMMVMEPSIEDQADDLAVAAREFPKAEKEEVPATPDKSVSDKVEDTLVSMEWLVQTGSRIAKVINTARTWFWGAVKAATVGGTTVAAVKAAGVSNGTIDTAGSVAADHLVLILCVVIAVLVAGLATFICLSHRHLLTAAKDGRYRPRGAAGQPAKAVA